MSGPDVTELEKEALAEGPFPSNPRSDFRMFLSPEVHQGTWAHAKQDTSVEICGVLVGHWRQDENGPYAVVTNFIQCESATSKFAEVTFTHDSWSQINDEMDSKYADARIVGWYHSHPDFGIFLSDRDCFIHEHFFSNPGQVAYVIDPIRELEGMFAWRQGKPTPLPHYWVGDTIERSDTGAARLSASPLPHAAGDGAGPYATAAANRPWWLDATTLVLLALLFLGLGFLLADRKSVWERQMLEQGVVAHYGLNQVARLGLEAHLSVVQGRLDELRVAIGQLPPIGAELEEDKLQAATTLRRNIDQEVAALRDDLRAIETQYGMTDDQRRIVLLMVAQKQSELLQLQLEAQKNSQSSPTIPPEPEEAEQAPPPAAEEDAAPKQQPTSPPTEVPPSPHPDAE